jgi:hypothetical protein
MIEPIREYLRQDVRERAGLEEAVDSLLSLVAR